mmetsp:Transcript_87000/g.243932  ORF Transcript_87000/g.243932 Transcript_87000/m.243932 type:complete len:400 (+) Transcript_87000:61-1260(+)
MVSASILPEPSVLASVAAFHEAFECPTVEGGPRLPSKDRADLRVALLQEELDELKTAIVANDLVECADAFADLQYVLSGAVLEFGMHRCFKDIFDEVHRSNMSKACSTQGEAEATVVHYAQAKGMQAKVHQSGEKLLVKRIPDQKVLKSVRYSPPHLRHFVETMTGVVANGTAEPEPEKALTQPASLGVPEPHALSSVASFHDLFEVPVVEDGPRIPSADRCQLRVSLLQEELDELQAAIVAQDLVECADALADLQYVLSGAVLEFGLQHSFKGIFDEVQRSNMSKLCTTLDEAEATVAHYLETKGVTSHIQESKAVVGKFLVRRQPDGKVLKSVNYSPASLRSLVHGAGAEKRPRQSAEHTPQKQPAPKRAKEEQCAFPPKSTQVDVVVQPKTSVGAA